MTHEYFNRQLYSSIHMLKLIAICLALACACTAQDAPPYVGGYVLLSRTSRNGEVVGMKELRALASLSENIPVNRIWISFFAPTMVYVPGSNTLEHARLNVSKTGDFGFADIKQAIAQLQVRSFFFSF